MKDPRQQDPSSNRLGTRTLNTSVVVECRGDVSHAVMLMARVERLGSEGKTWRATVATRATFQRAERAIWQTVKLQGHGNLPFTRS